MFGGIRIILVIVYADFFNFIFVQFIQITDSCGESKEKWKQVLSSQIHSQHKYTAQPL